MTRECMGTLAWVLMCHLLHGQLSVVLFPHFVWYLFFWWINQIKTDPIQFCFMSSLYYYFSLVPSMLWHCWLSSRKSIQPVKNHWVAGMVICLERGADLHMTQLMPLPLTVSCFSKIHIGFTFLVPVHPGSPRQKAVKWVCVCACVRACMYVLLFFHRRLTLQHGIKGVFFVLRLLVIFHQFGLENGTLLFSTICSLCAD